jgi:flagellin
MRDLAVQSLNATNSATDRADLDAQFQQLKADINSVAAQTQFNGVNLLDGTFQGATFQVGANAGQSITISSISSAKANNLGQVYTAAGTDNAAYAATAGDSGSFTITVNGTAYTTSAVTLTGNQATDLKTVAAAINQAVGSSTGVVATVDSAGQALNLSSTTATTTLAVAYTPTTGTENEATFGLSTTPALNATAAGTVNTANVLTVDSSNLVLVQVDSALQQLATSGAQLGAYQNRFQAAVTGLNTDSTNLTQARSQIQDTDYAAATSALSKAQILQQAGTSMVAQANTIPQSIMTLLQKLP